MVLPKEVIQEDHPNFAMRDSGAEKKSSQWVVFRSSSRFQNQSGPTENSLVLLCPLLLPRPLALLSDLLCTITLFDAKKYGKSDS